jgi:hypothetical protein
MTTGKKMSLILMINRKQDGILSIRIKIRSKLL